MSPVDGGAVFGIGTRIVPIMANFILNGFFIDLDAESWRFGKRQIAVLMLERLLDIACASDTAALLGEEVRNSGIELEASGEGDRAKGTVGSDAGIVRFSHASDEAGFEDAAGMGEVGLENASSALLENFAETPLGVEAFAGGNGYGGGVRDVRENIDVLTLHWLFDEEGVVGFKGGDETLGGLGGDGTMEVDGKVDVWPGGAAHGGEDFHDVVGDSGRFDEPTLEGTGDTDFEAVEAFSHGGTDAGGGRVGIVASSSAVDTDSLARWSTKESIHWLTEPFAVDIPEGLFDAGKDTGEEGTTAVEGVFVH